MRIRSFRTRITLLSVCVSGLVLVVFGLSAWALVYRVSLGRIDDELRSRIRPHLRGGRGLFAPPGPASPPEGEGPADRTKAPTYILLAKGPDGNVLHRSREWPEGIAPERFPSPPGGPPSRVSRPSAVPPVPSRDPRRQRAARNPERQPRAGGIIRPPVFSTARAEGQRWRLCVSGDLDVTLVLGVSLDEFGTEMGQVANSFLLALPAALLLIAAGSWLLSQRALRPLDRLAQVAEQVTASRLDQRIPSGNAETEFLRLITVFNEMLDRLERSFKQAVRFSADAAHELRTPLTILQGEIEQALQHAPDGSEQQQVCSNLLEEVQRLKAIVQKLLLLSRADSGRLQPALARVDLSSAVEDALEDTRALAPHLTVEGHVTPGLQMMADRALLQQVLQNLVSNAIKYNREGGAIEIRLRRTGAVAELTVANTGAGIPLEDRDKVFERFYRADRARSRGVDGVGLGLSLAQEIVRAHQGTLVLAGSQEGWTRFRVTLPLVGGGAAQTPDA